MSFINSNPRGHITADGDYSISMPPGRRVVVESAGNYDGATVTVGYIAVNTAFKAYRLNDADVTLASGDAISVTVTGNSEVVLHVAGSGENTYINYMVTPETDS